MKMLANGIELEVEDSGAASLQPQPSRRPWCRHTNAISSSAGR